MDQNLTQIEQRTVESRNRYLGSDIVEILTQPTPKDWKETRTGRGSKDFTYIPGYRFTERLNDAFGFLWSFRIKNEFERDGHIVTRGELSFKIPGKTVTKRYIDTDGKQVEEIIRFDGIEVVKEQYGSAEIKVYATNVELRKKGSIVRDSSGSPVLQHKKGDLVDLGDDYKASGTDCMKKCGLSLGLFPDIYNVAGSGDSDEGPKGVSESQLETLHMRGKRAGMTDEQTDAWAEKEIGKSLGEAAEMDVMLLIPKLVDLAKARK